MVGEALQVAGCGLFTDRIIALVFEDRAVDGPPDSEPGGGVEECSECSLR